MGANSDTTTLANSVPEMNQSTTLAQEPLRDETAQGRPDTSQNHRHEPKDANIKAIALIGAGLALLGLLMFGTLWLQINHYRRTPAPPAAPISPLALQQPVPGPPRVQDVNEQNNQRFIHQELDALRGSNAIPPPEGSGGQRIPIEQAKSELLQKGFPTRPQTGSPLFPQTAPAAGKDRPESLPQGMQPMGAYRADVGPTGKP